MLRRFNRILPVPTRVDYLRNYPRQSELEGTEVEGLQQDLPETYGGYLQPDINVIGELQKERDGHTNYEPNKIIHSRQHHHVQHRRHRLPKHPGLTQHGRQVTAKHFPAGVLQPLQVHMTDFSSAILTANVLQLIIPSNDKRKTFLINNTTGSTIFMTFRNNGSLLAITNNGYYNNNGLCVPIDDIYIMGSVPGKIVTAYEGTLAQEANRP